MPAWVTGPFTSVTRTADELSVVCRAASVPGTVQAERDWCAWRVEGKLDFSMVGVLAALATPLAHDGISVFVISTYDTDYLMVRSARAADAAQSLRQAGITIAD